MGLTIRIFYNNLSRMKYALISVSDRTGILEFAKKLRELEFQIIGTSGTREFLKSNGINCKSISALTGFPEILGGRVKSLHPKIFGAILADRENKSHLEDVKKLNIPLIEIVVCNLYPFDSAPGIENIDIGGVTLIRAAAKNYRYVTCVTSPGQYEKVIGEIEKNGKVLESTRFEFARKAFELTSSFDFRVGSFLARDKPSCYIGEERLNLGYERVMELRYGENPHQKASLYKEVGHRGLSVIDAVKLQGKELSFNNFYDLDAALSVVKSFDESCVCILKHATPCGVAIGDSVVEAYKDAYRADTISPFGGIVAFNREVDKVTAEEITKIFISAVIAPGYANEAMEVLARKKNMVVLELSEGGEFGPTSFRWIEGGLLLQESDVFPDDTSEWEVVTKRKPTDKELKAMEFGFKVVKFVKSNAVIITTDKMTLGIGGGQPNRVGALEIAIQNMKKFGLTRENPNAVASDGLFPFRDSVDLAAKEGIKAVVQPGGSIRDQEVIDACNEHGIAMVFTHKRHFRH